MRSAAVELILEKFFERALVVEIIVADTQRVYLVVIIGKAARGDRRTIDDGNDAVDRYLAADVRPVECGDERLRSAKPEVSMTILIRPVLFSSSFVMVGMKSSQRCSRCSHWSVR